jgi:hypothetical protein
MRADRPVKKQRVWERTRHQNLFRYLPSGTIFAWLKISGKQVRESLLCRHVYFTREFRKLLGVTPSEYRRQHARLDGAAIRGS